MERRKGNWDSCFSLVWAEFRAIVAKLRNVLIRSSQTRGGAVQGGVWAERLKCFWSLFRLEMPKAVVKSTHRRALGQAFSFGQKSEWLWLNREMLYIKFPKREGNAVQDSGGWSVVRLIKKVWLFVYMLNSCWYNRGIRRRQVETFGFSFGGIQGHYRPNKKGLQASLAKHRLWHD